MTREERAKVRSSGTLAPFMFTQSGLARTYTFRDTQNTRDQGKTASTPRRSDHMGEASNKHLDYRDLVSPGVWGRK